MKRILIVDDNIEFLELLSSVLKTHFQTYEATGVQEAIKLLETVTVDAICSDFNMRDGTGLDFLQQLRQQDVKSRLYLCLPVRVGRIICVREIRHNKPIA